MPIALKRVYDLPAARDGVRILVDRLWPRGLTKKAAQLDAWLRDVAPSNELRRWYHGHPDEWEKFRTKYLQELSQPAAESALSQLYQLSREKKRVTLLFASKLKDRNNATVLKELLEGMRKPPIGTGPAHAASTRKAAARRR